MWPPQKQAVVLRPVDDISQQLVGHVDAGSRRQSTWLRSITFPLVPPKSTHEYIGMRRAKLVTTEKWVSRMAQAFSSGRSGQFTCATSAQPALRKGVGAS